MWRRPLMIAVGVLTVTASTESLTQESCEKICQDDKPKCLKVLDPEDGARPVDFSPLFAALSDPTKSTITQSEMLGFFDQTEDPCNRSSTLVETLPPETGNPVGDVHTIFNEGDSCQVTATVTLPSGFKLKAGFFVPEVLRLRFKFLDEKTLSIEPEPTSGSNVIWFDDNEFFDDFGGPVQHVKFGAERSYVTTQNGCIEVDMGTGN